MRPAAAAIAKPMRKGQRLRDICSTSVSTRGCVVIVVTVIDGDWLEVVPAAAAPALEADAVTLFVATVSAASMRSEVGRPTLGTASRRGLDALTFGGLRR